MPNIAKLIISIKLISLAIFSTQVALAHSLEKESDKTDKVSETAEKRVTLYTSYGYKQDKYWFIPLRAWISEDMGITRSLSLKAARKAIQKKADIEELTDDQKQRFKFRAEDFLRDSESDEIIDIQFDNDVSKMVYQLVDSDGNLETDRNGNIQGTIVISEKKATQTLLAQNSKNGWLKFNVVSDNMYGAGKVRLIPEEGLSIISDIDDTIKVTEIPSGTKTVLRNTFFKPFKAAPNMLPMYRDLSEETAFHYVSGGPWQLYTGLTDFMFENGVNFPLGSLHMKNVRTNLTESESYQDIIKLVEGSATVEQKLEQISGVFSHFPKRKFILIGDSGEHDPEIFAQIKRRFPKQVKEIRIRDIVNDSKLNPNRLKGMTVISVAETQI